MAEIITCPKCGKRLQVPEQHLGATVQCPDCRHMFVAQVTALSTQPLPASSSKGKPQTERTRTYDDDEVERPRRRRDADDDFDDEFDDDSRPRFRSAPHRGGLILALGLIGLVGGMSICVPVIVGPIAWFMASVDLREMGAGRMDPSGMSMTQTGHVLGIISTVFLILGGLCLGFGILSEVFN